MPLPRRAGVSAAASVRVPWSDLAALRAAPGEFRGESLAPLVRQSDDLTLLGVVAVLRAIDAAGWHDRSFENWGVVASGRGFGRIRFDAAINRYRKMHARGASPLTVPHLSLHAAASTVSIALGMHGPNFGVSGQAGHLSETLLMGMGTLQDESIDGLWMVAAEYDPQPSLGPDSEPVHPVVAQAAALALTRDDARIELALTPGAGDVAALTELVDWLASSRNVPWRGGIPDVAVAELRRTQAAVLRKAS